MNQDIIWQAIRYFLIVAGGYAAGKGIIPADKVAGLVDQLINTAPAVISLVTVMWGFYVKWRTRAVPEATALRADVPTVSAATGAKETGSSHT